ncbi:hypothetical protein SDRG_11890 [Saprolegnia diclina VS20]|uniref:Uncharacterized protein n=1 Tax=Saprolegnia diclina (strain VS20) TaxID=1156394 RepID=T0RDH6_SAPDV|nr:hypothetical protein SDRG_11890 [Saprolegnia diclina VS20]EQC30313.1 hypothetical protein SDRG_11890 [Saprolegnia diclina VS20]|eukprot:XP_008616166.1 hypothetical protein SDRG_11890 [Saprolegnia diclina VS20]
MLDDGRDVTSLLKALPPLTLPLELVALRDLGAAINLADHWPVVHVIAIPIEHARLAIDALPAFEGVFVNLGVAALVWLDATLPPAMPITLVLSPEELGTSSAFAYAWGDRITNVIVRGATVRKDPMPDMLGRCVNVQSVLIEANFVPVDKYVDALSTKQLHALQLDDMGQNTVDASGIVARLEEPRATTLSLTCNSVRDPAPLATAIQDCSHLTSLRLGDALDVKAASVSLHHVTSLAILDNGFDDRLPVGPLRKLDRSKVVSFLLEHDVGDEGDEIP